MRKRILILLFIVLAFSLAFTLGSELETVLITDPTINEASGIAASISKPGILYTHNDSGGKNAVFVMDNHGSFKGSYILETVKNRDWEDIALSKGPRKKHDYIYVGEIGDNGGRHKTVYVYRFPEPDLPKTANFEERITEFDRIQIIYEDGPRDAEALFVNPNTLDIYIISKREDQVGVYEVKYPQSTSGLNTARKIITLPLSWITAADMSPNGDQIILKTYTAVYKWDVKKKQSVAEALQGKMSSLPYQLEPQGEGICFDHKGDAYYTLSERSKDKPLYLYYYK
ncbi:MAG: hypothetical protein PHI68_02305 [Candidatus Cloacimonetes bacterium]|nr:hypothetical protein [Candidatus Cloacimonadota bacterium]